ncbi:hypothetical protein JKP23_02680 [Vibrio vulnificus]|uniref:hypothetical protein n=1 Tax=Vibrio vulnificus TaxID=672 RepID=UPI001CDBC304|nr:hypothetical protein [Vibrio vulnificus]MCA3895985.1 hypothetical protein [Vibrio vulnificus]
MNIYSMVEILSHYDVKASFIKELIETKNYALLEHNFAFFKGACNSADWSRRIELLGRHEYQLLFSELNDCYFDGSVSPEVLNLWTKDFEANAHSILIDEFSRYIQANQNVSIFGLMLNFSLKLQHVIELILTVPEDNSSQALLLDMFRETQEKKQLLIEEMALLEIGSDEYIQVHETLLSLENELLQIAKEVKSTKEKSNLAAEKETLIELLEPLIKLGLPYYITSNGKLDSFDTLYSSSNKVLECLASQYFSLSEEDTDSIRKHIPSNLVSSLQVGESKSSNFSVFRYIFLPTIPDLPSLLRAIEIALIHLNDLLVTLDPENAEISKIAELPLEHKNVKKFRLYEQNGLAILSTRRGTKVLEFQSMEEADKWSRQYLLLNSDVTIRKARPTPKKLKVTTVSTYSTASSRKRTLVVGNANASTICRTCNGTGLWGNCRNCGGKGFL